MSDWNDEAEDRLFDLDGKTVCGVSLIQKECHHGVDLILLQISFTDGTGMALEGVGEDVPLKIEFDSWDPEVAP